MTRDPRINPRPGDEISAGGVIRRVLKREGSKVLTATGLFQSWMRVDRWQNGVNRMALRLRKRRIRKSEKWPRRKLWISPGREFISPFQVRRLEPPRGKGFRKSQLPAVHCFGCSEASCSAAITVKSSSL